MAHTDIRAAVAMIVSAEPEPAVLLMRRSQRTDDPWSGHWALPGGRREDTDADLRVTAMREAHEECGVSLDPAWPSQRLPDGMAGRSVARPVWVAAWRWDLPISRPVLTLDPAEVQATCWFPLAHLTNPAAHRVGSVPGLVNHPPVPQLPNALLADMPLWGFTWRVLVSHFAPAISAQWPDTSG